MRGLSPEAVTTTITAALDAEGFAIVPTLAAPPDDRSLLAEKNVRRVATHVSTRVTMGVLVAAGVGLGGVDAYLAGSLIYGVPWFAIGFGIAGLMWWRYGRTFESDVVRVIVRLPRGGSRDSLGPPGPLEVGWGAGRVRSVLFSGERTTVAVVDCPVPLMESLSRAVHRFEAECRPTVPGGLAPLRLRRPSRQSARVEPDVRPPFGGAPGLRNRP